MTKDYKLNRIANLIVSNFTFLYSSENKYTYIDGTGLKATITIDPIIINLEPTAKALILSGKCSIVKIIFNW